MGIGSDDVVVNHEAEEGNQQEKENVNKPYQSKSDTSDKNTEDEQK